MSWREQHVGASKRVVVYDATVNGLWSGDANDPNGQDNVPVSRAGRPAAATGCLVPRKCAGSKQVVAAVQAEVWRAGMLKDIVLSAWSVKRRRSSCLLVRSALREGWRRNFGYPGSQE